MSKNQSHQPELIDHEAARRNARVIALLVAVAMAVAVGVGLAVGLLRNGHDGRHHSAVVAVLVFVGVLVLALAIMVPLMLRLYRRPNYSRVLQYGWGQRRRVGKALRKGRPIAAHDRPVADALVRTMRQQRWLPYLFGVLLLTYVARAVFDHGFQRWFAIALVALYVVVIPWMLWQRRTVLANYDRLEPNQPDAHE